jgi:hypothetical protein
MTRPGIRPLPCGLLLAALWAVPWAAPVLAAGEPSDRPYPHGSWREDCSLCHREENWLPAQISKQFEHTKKFPLAGAHRTASCRACHRSLEFEKVGRACVECHQDVHRGEFGLDCARCHSTRNFLDRAAAARNHRTTRFPLTGAHAVADCEACHRMVAEGKSRYVGLSTDCAACHNRAGFPGAQQRPADHAQANFPLDCVQCHSTVTFGTAQFDHNNTGFPLTGVHRSLGCVQCHGSPFNAHLDPTCYACHAADYNGTTDPNHRQAGFPTDCLQCHTTASGWQTNFNHNATQFPLTGAHVSLSCNQCHGDGVYRGKPTACVSCHQANYTGTTNPNHAQAQFPTDCTLCHTTAPGWTTTWSHSTNTSFPLTGAHVGLTCNQCHGDGVYQGRSTACVSCHRANYNSTTNPNHAQAQFPTDCTLCHTTTPGWTTTWSHTTNTSFPLTGAHVGLSCNQCHGDGVYAGKPTDCYSCHQAQYTAQTDPNHVAANFDHNCTLCHTTTTFAGARYTQHDSLYFPIYSGTHSGRWTNCSDCHTTSANYAAFSCFLCHSQNGTNSQHNGVSGYSYDSAACYRCHPTGRSE